eukprot:g4339.t1
MFRTKTFQDGGYDYFFRVDTDLFFVAAPVVDPFKLMAETRCVMVYDHLSREAPGCFDDFDRRSAEFLEQMEYTGEPDVDILLVGKGPAAAGGQWTIGDARFFTTPLYLQFAEHMVSGIYAHRWSEQLILLRTPCNAACIDAVALGTAMAEAEREAEDGRRGKGADNTHHMELILNASIETFVDDQVIFREHDDVDRIYFIQHGEAAVCVDDQPIEKISSGKVIGMGAIFESLGLPVTIKAMAACNMRTVTKQNFLSALQKYPEEASHLRTFAERLCKEDSVSLASEPLQSSPLWNAWRGSARAGHTTRWEKRSAILRTKRKLKAISAMRGGRKHLAPKDDTFDRQASSMSGVSETPVSPGRPLQDEATRRAKVQAIRAQMQARARGAPGEVPAPAAPPSSPDPGRRARTRTQSGVGVAEKTTSQDEVRPCGPGALSQSPEDSLMEVDDLNTLEQISPAATTMEERAPQPAGVCDSGLARQQSTGSETMITASSGTREGHRVRRQHSAGTRGKEEDRENEIRPAPNASCTADVGRTRWHCGHLGKVERRSMKRSFLPVVPGAKPSEGA